MRLRALACLAGTLGSAALAPVAASADGQPAAALQGSGPQATGPQSTGPLSAPGDYSLVPPALVKGGVVSTSVGSNGLRSTAVRLDSGLLAGGARAFLLVGAGQGLRWHERPAASGSGVAVGLEAPLPHGTTLSLTASHEQGRLGGPGGFGSAWPP